MKSHFEIKKMKKFLLIALASSLTYSCSTDPIAGFTIRISPEVMTYTVSIDVSDATSGLSVQDDVELVISGDNADDIYTVFGTRDFEVYDGNIQVGLHPRANPVPGAPVSISIQVVSQDFLVSVFTQRFFAEQKQYSKTVEMINTQTPPPGVGFGTNTGAVAGDSTASNLLVSITSDSTQTDTSLALAVSAGTSFFDAAGNSITGSNLNVNVAYFSGSTSASLAAFPGGLAQTGVTLPDGSVSDVVFEPLSFSDVNMDIDGTEVKQFSDSIEIVFKVDTALINPDTGLKYAVGDSVELWTNDSSTIWTFERYATVEQGLNGLEIIYETDHLSGKAPMKSKGICPVDPVVRFVFTNWPANAIKTMKLNLFRNGTPLGGSQIINFPQAGYNLVLNDLSASNNAAIRAVLTDPEDGSTYNVAMPYSCGTTFLDATFNNVPTPPAQVTFDLTAKCPSDASKVFRPSGFNIRARRTDGTSSNYPDYNYLATIQNGQAAAALTQNVSYDFRVHLGEGYNYDTTVTVNQMDYVYTASRQVICSYQP